MADDTYRKFHSGRFGPEDIDINFETKIEGSKGVTGSNPKKEKTFKDKEGNTYKDKETADMFDEQNKFMKD